MNRSNIDLNLLAVLDALLAERNVTQAARRVHLSQPAASNALARLRHVFKDPLLVRGAGGLTLTPRAEELELPVRQAMMQIDAALNQRAVFDPATATDTFSIAASDGVEVALLPSLIARLRNEAPGIDLRFRPLPSVSLAARPMRGDIVPEEELGGDLDLALGFFPDPPQRLHARALFEGTFVCAVRKDHPAVKSKLSLRQFLALSHVVVASRSQGWHGVVDAALAKRNLARHVALVVPQFTVVPYIIAQSDFIVTLPRGMAAMFARTFDIRLVEPLSLPEFAISQVWHERTHHSAAHQWLRSVIAELAVRLSGINAKAAAKKSSASVKQR